jgi:hypothetical protein
MNDHLNKILEILGYHVSDPFGKAHQHLINLGPLSKDSGNSVKISTKIAELPRALARGLIK